MRKKSPKPIDRLGVGGWYSVNRKERLVNMMKNNILRKIIRIMSSVLKSIVIIAISSIIVFALVLKVKAIKEGSNMNTKKYTIEEKKEKTLEYMKERYGEDFVGLRWSGKNFFHSVKYYV